jgi:hypothetical protein
VEILTIQDAPPVSTTSWQICHRYQRHQWQILPPVPLELLIPVANLPPVSTIPPANLPPVSIATGINDTGGKFATGINNTGGK